MTTEVIYKIAGAREWDAAFAVGADGALWRRSYAAGTWGAWTSLRGIWNGSPAAVCQPTTTRIDLFERGTDNGAWTEELPG